MRLPMHPRTILLGIVVLAVSFAVSLKAMDWLAPRTTVPQPQLAQLPPLPPASRSSTIVAKVAVALSAIRDAAERGAPKTFAGKANNPVSQILENADIGWTASRGPIAVTGAQDVLTLATPINGALKVTGSLSAKASGAVGNALGSLLGANVAKQIGAVNIKQINANADIKGNVTLTSRPKLGASWRIEPNLQAQVNLDDSSLSAAGVRVSVPAQVKPVIDKTVADQIAAVEAKLHNDPTFETNARAQWTKACRSIPLQGTGGTSSMPPMWLELRPTRVIAAQPKIDASSMTITMGVEAETRITETQTTPNCPFPEKLSIVPPMSSQVSIDLPVDMSFTTLTQLVEEQLKNKTFPEDGSGPVDVTVKHASVAASGDRLLISLLVHAKEKKSYFGFGAEATVYIWGRPRLDQQAQTLRLTDVELAVESEAAFGLLGAAARAVIPHLQQTLADRLIVDLKPFASNAQRKIAAAVADLQKNEEGIRVDADITSIRLAGIDFDSKTLRVLVETEGTINAAVSALPAR
ncbi:DUF4403 family protein [Bradyrhizobium sp. ISRA443]|uniref:DUF4403 family protein n=1 Tax=unclassified Bradyrhizobium TaxID=2631580 RepID=UPI0024784B33|nr:MULTISPECIES: DUF4403 family protein [unclassified Bradyrhizobium]WGR95817.1 DUF4403 family protein [Bradyrhizobium sp. ISRA435]WGS00939.1 DUF4403 family protein [Bradyrhizobium sp. ISRA436]WGS07826.1 DUF4403 family protein [Bradyrhizobium sp. ISRA437]WGS14714.1 DUF4403 family protein [Bradyrhizobium sp. ISRA443]